MHSNCIIQHFIGSRIQLLTIVTQILFTSFGHFRIEFFELFIEFPGIRSDSQRESHCF